MIATMLLSSSSSSSTLRAGHDRVAVAAMDGDDENDSGMMMTMTITPNDGNDNNNNDNNMHGSSLNNNTNKATTKTTTRASLFSPAESPWSPMMMLKRRRNQHQDKSDHHHCNNNNNNINNNNSNGEEGRPNNEAALDRKIHSPLQQQHRRRCRRCCSFASRGAVVGRRGQWWWGWRLLTLLRQWLCCTRMRKFSSICLWFSIMVCSLVYYGVFIDLPDTVSVDSYYELLARQTQCAPHKWHSYSFPTCNDVHDIDLRSIEERSRFSRSRSNNHNNSTTNNNNHNSKHQNSTTTSQKIGYLARGYWRSVWAVDPREIEILSGKRAESSRSSSTSETIVLKMMRMIHNVTDRNFDRHRRDALVMERLSASPHVADVYGFCGNSVLTEFIGMTMEELSLLKAGDAKHVNDAKSSMIRFLRTSTDRLRLALQVAQGVQALHQVSGGPIIHTDIMAKQFLVTPTGDVKINDFNRCRFMGYHKKTGKACNFRISMAPGNARSPEEYDMSAWQDEKLDVFSMANVLYGIVTGIIPWDRYPSWSDILQRRLIRAGVTPWMPYRYRQSDPALVAITKKAYTRDAAQRPSAATIVKWLEEALAEAEDRAKKRKNISGKASSSLR